MRDEYHELQAVGGLMVQSSSLKLIQELKEQQEQVANDVKNEVCQGILETLQEYNIAGNQENVNTNQDYIVPIFPLSQPLWHTYLLAPALNQSSLDPSTQQMFGASQQTVTDLTMIQLLQHTQATQAQIGVLTVAK